jgi:hypothetical protein
LKIRIHAHAQARLAERGATESEVFATIEQRWEGDTLVIDDPGAYTKAFTATGAAHLMAGDELIEYVCNENNQDVNYLIGAKP